MVVTTDMISMVDSVVLRNRSTNSTKKLTDRVIAGFCVCGIAWKEICTAQIASSCSCSSSISAWYTARWPLSPWRKLWKRIMRPDKIWTDWINSEGADKFMSTITNITKLMLSIGDLLSWNKTLHLFYTLSLTSIRIFANFCIKAINGIAVAREAFEFDSFLSNDKKVQTVIRFK